MVLSIGRSSFHRSCAVVVEAAAVAAACRTCEELHSTSTGTNQARHRASQTRSTRPIAKSSGPLSKTFASRGANAATSTTATTNPASHHSRVPAGTRRQHEAHDGDDQEHGCVDRRCDGPPSAAALRHRPASGLSVENRVPLAIERENPSPAVSQCAIPCRTCGQQRSVIRPVTAQHAGSIQFGAAFLVHGPRTPSSFHSSGSQTARSTCCTAGSS